jgi:hypothetical protein
VFGELGSPEQLSVFVGAEAVYITAPNEMECAQVELGVATNEVALELLHGDLLSRGFAVAV